MRRVSPIALLLLLMVGVATALYTQSEHRAAHSQTGINPASYLYYTLKDPKGFVLARAPKGAKGQPLAAPQPITLLGDDFGLSESDSVSSIQLSPDGQYLEIDGARDHGEQVWMYDTQTMKVSLLPSHVIGNFLHWLSPDLSRGEMGRNGHMFLYRPMFPIGPLTDGNVWNPGLWIVDAATGGYTNIDIHTPSAYLIDAAPSPDGSRIIYSTTTGLGRGSDTWMMNSDGTGLAHLFRSASGVQSIAGLFAWSPDGTSIAYERLSDSSTPFLPAGLWIMNSQGGQQRRLADTDGGHGFTLTWSPDSRKVAFVVRTNVNDSRADVLMQSLQCAIGVVDVSSGRSWLVVSANQTGMQMNINPTWTADSASITFTALNPANRVLGGTPRYWSVKVAHFQVHPAVTPLTPVIPHVVAVG